LKTSNKIESNLIIGLKRDDHESFRKLFEKYNLPLYNFSLKYLKLNQAAEDVVQEVFIKIWDKRKEIRTDTSLKSYLFTIAMNSIRKQFNKQSRYNEIKHEILVNSIIADDVFDERQDYQELLDKLTELVNEMPEKRRQVFTEKKFEEKSVKEISVKLNISEKTVEYHITQATNFLRKEFQKRNEDGLIFFHLFINS
jgi:RNA polymerase sigma-70 factor (family 1)